MTPTLRHLRRGAVPAFVVLWLAAPARAQDAAPQPLEGVTQNDASEVGDERDDLGLPAADLSAEQIELMVAGASYLFPLLPHEKGGQPGSAVEGFAIMESAVDSLGDRGRVELSEEETRAIMAGLMRNAIPARLCGVACSGAYGDAALNFHVPRVEGDEATVWISTYWAIAQLPDQPPDRILNRGDEIRLRREGDRWKLAGHTKLREQIRFVTGSSLPGIGIPPRAPDDAGDAPAPEVIRERDT